MTRYDELGHELMVGWFIQYDKKCKGKMVSPYGKIEEIFEDGSMNITHYGYKYFPNDYKDEDEVIETIKLKPRVTLKPNAKVFLVEIKKK